MRAAGRRAGRTPRRTLASMAPRVQSKSAAKIPEQVLRQLSQRLTAHAKAKWPGCRAVEVRSRGAYAYVDAQGKDDAQLEPLCRLRYLGSPDSWEFAFFTWSREAYEPSVLDTGLPFGTPEDCFDAAAFSLFEA